MLELYRTRTDLSWKDSGGLFLSSYEESLILLHKK